MRISRIRLSDEIHAFAHGKLVVRGARRVSPYSCQSRSAGKRISFPVRTLWFLCRCRHKSHKCRNVLGHLPERLHASVGKALRDAWNLDSADRAARVLERLAGSLERDHPGAAASIREGLEETLTVQRLGLTGALQRTLRTTNIIENLNGSVERYTRNVKRWRGGQMIQRWVASALVEAEPRFRRVRGYRDVRYLVGALDALAPPDEVVAEVA